MQTKEILQKIINNKLNYNRNIPHTLEKQLISANDIWNAVVVLNSYSNDYDN